MAMQLRAIRDFHAGDAQACLALFDANCPQFFAPNERADYEAFLVAPPPGYRVLVDGEQVIAAFGLIRRAGRNAALNWILIDPHRQRAGLGSTVMKDVLESARAAGERAIDIAASQHSAPFFARFGAVEQRHTPDGWGPGMHRIDMRLPLVPAEGPAGLSRGSC